MKKAYIFLVAIGLVVVCGLTNPVAANSVYAIADDNHVWQPTDTTINAVNFGTGKEGWSLFMMAAGGSSITAPSIPVVGAGLGFSTVIFDEDLNTAMAGGNTLNLGNDLSFEFFFSNGSAYATYQTKDLGNGVYELFCGNAEGMTVTVTDVSHVPLPTSMLLLGTGLLGLVGFRRQTNRK